MDVSPKTLREVEFREKMRGYHPEDVDKFLEQVAAGLEVLQDRLRQAVDRAQRAEAAASEGGASDDTLRKTLVLAQRTADLAVQEARDQSARILAGAEQQAQAMLSEAEERGRRAHEESLADMRADLARLEAVRQQAQGEVDLIRRWVEDHRTTLTASLTEALGMLERANVTSPPPTSRPIDLPPQPRTAASGSSFPAQTGEVEAHPTGPETIAWQPPDDRAKSDEHYFSQLRRASADPATRTDPSPRGDVPSRTDPPLRTEAPPRAEAPSPRTEAPRPGARGEAARAEGSRPEGTGRAEAPGRPEAQVREKPGPYEGPLRAEPGTRPAGGARPEPSSRAAANAGRARTEPEIVDDGPDEQALDDFFDDEQFADERRFGGRLRRRR